MYLDLDLIKNALNIEQDFKDDDFYLLQLAEAAIEATKKEVDIKEEDEMLDNEGNIKPSLKQAILLLIGLWYAQRETAKPGAMQRVPYAYEYLCD